MRILMINNLYPPIQVGGGEKLIVMLAESLVKRGDQVSVITLHPKRDEILEVVNGVRVYRLPLDNVYWPFHPSSSPNALSKLAWHAKDTWNTEAKRRVARILDIEQPQVVHSSGLCGFSVAIWGEVKKRNIRLVHTLQDFYLLCKNSAFFSQGKHCRRRCRFCRFVTQPRCWASSNVDTVVSISEYVLDAHRRCGQFVNVPSFLVYHAAEPEANQKPARGSDPDLVFGFIGRVEQEKGIDVLLEATKKLNKNNWRLRIAGTGKPPFVAALKNKYGDVRIEWLGFVDAHSFYRTVDVVIIPSVWPEPMGRIVIEAFAARRSVICARSGGIPEVSSFGKQVATYPATDVDALADLMNSGLIDRLPWRDGGYRDEAAQKLFSEKYIVDRYRAIYANVADHAGTQ